MHIKYSTWKTCTNILNKIWKKLFLILLNKITAQWNTEVKVEDAMLSSNFEKYY